MNGNVALLLHLPLELRPIYNVPTPATQLSEPLCASLRLVPHKCGFNRNDTSLCNLALSRGIRISARLLTLVGSQR